MSQALQARLHSPQRLYEQRRGSKNKLYALHAPELECIPWGLRQDPYEFAVKVSVAVTAKESVVVGMRSMPGTPYDGHTLYSQLEQVEILTGVRPSIALADCGYKAAGAPPGTRLLPSHTRRLPKPLKKLLRRRQAIEPTSGHTENNGLPGRNWLKGEIGDAMHAVRSRSQPPVDPGGLEGLLGPRVGDARSRQWGHPVGQRRSGGHELKLSYLGPTKWPDVPALARSIVCLPLTLAAPLGRLRGRRRCFRYGSAWVQPAR